MYLNFLLFYVVLRLLLQFDNVSPIINALLYYTHYYFTDTMPNKSDKIDIGIEVT